MFARQNGKLLKEVMFKKAHETWNQHPRRRGVQHWQTHQMIWSFMLVLKDSNVKAKALSNSKPWVLWRMEVMINSSLQLFYEFSLSVGVLFSMEWLWDHLSPIPTDFNKILQYKFKKNTSRPSFSRLHWRGLVVPQHFFSTWASNKKRPYFPLESWLFKDGIPTYHSLSDYPHFRHKILWYM